MSLRNVQKKRSSKRASCGARRLRTASVSLAVLSGLSVAACSTSGSGSTSATGSGSAATQSVTINYGYDGTVPSSWPGLFAYYAGFFKQYGITVKLVPTTESVAEAELTKGELTFSEVATSLAIADAAGEKNEAVFDQFQRFPFYFMVKPGITAVSQLKGKKIGDTSADGPTAAAASLFLKANGISTNEVTLVPLGSPSGVVAGAAAGSIDAAAIPIGSDSIELQAQGWHVLDDLAANGPYEPDSIAANDSYVQSNPALTQHVVDALTEAIETMAQNKALTLEIAEKYIQPGLPQSTYQTEYNDYVQEWKAGGVPSTVDYSGEIAAVKQGDPSLGAVTPGTLFDATFAEQALTTVKADLSGS